MAKRLDAFPEDQARGPRRYPWAEWTDGGVWEIRRGEDYDAATENMRVNLHMKADALTIKVRTRKVRDENGEGLVFQFLDPEGEEMRNMLAAAQSADVDTAMELLHGDAMEIYERARREVTIPRKDGTRQKYAAVRFKREIEKAHEDGTLVRTVARIVRRPTVGFGHLDAANRPDLMLENLVLDTTKPYHRFFTEKTIETARTRMAAYEDNATKPSDPDTEYVLEIDRDANGYDWFKDRSRTQLPGVLAIHREGGSLEPMILGQEAADEVKAWLASIAWDTEKYAVRLTPRWPHPY
ncbi:MAG: hypothetical protein ACHQE6_05200 [Solirubrobacterales bacterium]